MRAMCIVFFCCLFPLGVLGEEPGEHLKAHEEKARKVQFRLSLHGQRFFSGEDGLGIAGWGVVPDLVTIREEPSGLLIAGLVYKKDCSDIELLGGVHTNRYHGEPVLDLRGTHEMSRWEAHFIATYLIDSEVVEFEPELTYETPWHVRVGGELEVGRKGDWVWSLGPKLIVPLPLLVGSSVRATYQFGPEDDFLRTELWLEF